jgi:two-component system, cell cycle response regulator DivK
MNKKILLVENDIPSIKVIKYFLHEDYDVDHALNGISALKLVKEKKYSVILMDIGLGPGINGLEVISTIKNLPGYKNVPIVAVTAHAMSGDKEKFLEHGCSHYISKPFFKNELLSLLNSIT